MKYFFTNLGTFYSELKPMLRVSPLGVSGASEEVPVTDFFFRAVLGTNVFDVG